MAPFTEIVRKRSEWQQERLATVMMASIYEIKQLCVRLFC